MSNMGSLRRWRHRVWGFNTYCRRDWVAAEAAKLPAGTRVLDVGAGSGQYRRLFDHCEYRTHDFGQEPSSSYTSLDYESDITAIPVPDDAFDAVLCTEVLEHVPEPIRAVREMARLVRPGGRILLTAPLGSWLHQEPYHFYGGYTPHWYRKFLNEAGCDVEAVIPNEGFFSFLGTEVQRFRLFTHPSQTRRLPLGSRVIVTLLWVCSIALSEIIPPLGRWMDRLNLESIATTGYHVAAVKRRP